MFNADAGFFRTLDSSIKRNTAVIKKLKQINEEQRESLMDDLRSVNLSKFVSEAVAAICDAKLRSADIHAAVQVFTFLFLLFSAQKKLSWEEKISLIVLLNLL
jgi:regulator of nonsense transcripts 2